MPFWPVVALSCRRELRHQPRNTCQSTSSLRGASKRGLPVADPARLVSRRRRGQLLRRKAVLRTVGECFRSRCFERLKAETPEFEAAGGVPGRRRAFERAAPRRRHCRAGRCAPSSSPATTSRRSASARFGGRVMMPTMTRPSSPAGAVLSHHIWQRRYGADPAVVGSTFVVEGHPFTAIGIAAARILSVRPCAAIRRISGFRCTRNP